MTDNPDIITIEPIGIIENEFEDDVPKSYELQNSKIIIKSELSDGLLHLEENSHILVIFWLDRIEKDSRDILKVHPKGREDIPLTGVFATRSPQRPNPIAIRAVKLVKIEGNVLTVVGLDALNQTPVLDIKPYSSKHDHVDEFRSPSWISKVQKKYEQKEGK